MKHTFLILSCIFILFVADAVCGVDWPCYNADPQRSGITAEKLNFPLAPAWTYHPAQSPRPAWPEPGRALNLLDFDYAFQPVIANGMVFFGSSADDSIYALNAETGAEEWHFTANAPIRFAPHIADGKCYFAADDGQVYCLNAPDGKLVWQFQAAPENRMLPGNDRVISRWPCRSGVLVVDDVVYVTAGMWPSEGVLLYALSADSGEVIWCNDTSSSMYLKYPHSPSVSFGGPAPQGYLLSTHDLLLVPTGKALPAAFERKTGALKYYTVANGASWVTLAGDYFFTPRVKLQGDSDVTSLGENGPQEGDGLGARRIKDGKADWPLSDSHYALVTNDLGKVIKREIQHGLSERQRMLADGTMIYACGEGVIEALDCSSTQAIKRIWSVKFPRVYTIILAGNTLIAGGANQITAWNAKTGEQTWHADINGQVRGLAVADGRLIAATDKGTIISFGNTSSSRNRIARRNLIGNITDYRNLSDNYITLRTFLPDLDACRGFALIVGEHDARLAEELAEATYYHIICLLPDEKTVQAERDRLLASGTVYGTRITLHSVSGSAELPYAKYFANLTVVSSNAHGISPGELYRVVRPSGGQLVCLDAARPIADAILAQEHIPSSAIRTNDNAVVLTKGKLSGSFDWDSENERDQLVKWPLELLWFGGPGPDRMVARHWKAPTPVYANGRYFVIGPYHLIGVDAYNGCELWSRQIGGHSVYRTVAYAADDDTVYVNFDGYCVAFAAQTGNVKGVYGPRKKSAWIALSEPQTFVFSNDTRVCGTLMMESRPEGLALTLRTIPLKPLPKTEEKRRAPTAAESWELHFDFRSPNACFADDSTGLFRIAVSAETGEHQKILSITPPPYSVQKQTVSTGNEVTLLLTWDDLKNYLDYDPAGFKFAATLYTGSPDRRFGRIDVFANGMNSFLNSGWATCILDTSRTNELNALTVPVQEGSLADLPDYARTYPRQPTQYTAQWTIDAMDRFELTSWPPAERDDISPVRTMPLTGTESPRTYSRSYGCCGTISSMNLDFMRSGTIGIYDREDDSGMRNFSAIKPGCGMTMVPAGGILVASEGAADCICAYNFQTSLALAPADRRKNEDWAMFNGRMHSALIRQEALNLGAPGDRRDQDGTLWLGFPRQTVALEKGMYTFDIPCTLEYYNGFGPYRYNADRTEINGTDRPWLYASGCRGIKKATLNLFYASPQTCLALESTQPPVLDAVLDDPCWNGIAPLQGMPSNTTVFLRQDADNLYIASERTGVIDRRGKIVPFDVVLRNENGSRFYRVSAGNTGKGKTALLDYSFDVPRLNDVTVDGKVDDWQSTGFQISLGTSAVCRFAWNDDGLLVSLETSRGWYCDTTNMTGIMIMCVRPGSADYYQLSLNTRTGIVLTDHRIRTNDDVPPVPVARNVSGMMHWGRPFGEVLSNVPGIKAESSGAGADSAVTAEVLLPWDSFKITPEQGAEVAFTVLAYDPDQLDPQFKTGNDCRPRILEGRKTMNRLCLADRADSLPAAAAYQRKQYGYDMYRLEIPVKERVMEKTAVSHSAAVAGGSMRVELAVPWAELAQQGIQPNNLHINAVLPAGLSGLFEQADRKFKTAAHTVYAQSKIPETRSYTVRMHFMELENVKPGERVFDIRMQDAIVARNVDIVKEAGAPHTAIVKEFTGIKAGSTVSVEFIPRTSQHTKRTVPVLSAIELQEE